MGMDEGHMVYTTARTMFTNATMFLNDAHQRA